MIYDTQPHIKYGFIDMNGNLWPHQWVDAYNLFTDSINKTAGKEIKSGSLSQQSRDYLLDQRHRLFVSYCELAKQRTELMVKKYDSINCLNVLKTC